MSPGSIAHNASTTALTRAAAGSPSSTHMARDSTERYATNADSRGRTKSPLTPKRLEAVPDRMRAADGQNAGVQREVRRRQRDGWKAGCSSLVFCAGGGLGVMLDPAGGGVSRGALDVCCWRCAGALAVESG